MSSQQAVPQDPPPTPQDETQEVPPEQTEVRYTAEETEEIKEIARRLMDGDKADKFTIGACVTLLASRQVYMAAMVDLQARLTELEVKHQDGVRQTLIDAMRIQAQEPFTRTLLLDKVQKHVLPWLMATVQSENAKEAAKDAQREKLLDEERRARAVPIGISLEQDLPDDPKLLVRDRTLVLAGHPGAVKYLVHKAGQVALTQPETRNVPKLRVIHLSSYAPINLEVPLKQGKGKLHVTVGEEQWKEKCRSLKKFTQFMAPWVRRMRRGGVDLLLIDDMTRLLAKSHKDQSPLRVAEQAQRWVRKWADEQGCAVVGGVPLEESQELPEITDDWGNLEVYTTLRRIELREGQYDEDYECDTYQIFLDNKALAANLVDRKIIDNYKD